MIHRRTYPRIGDDWADHRDLTQDRPRQPYTGPTPREMGALAAQVREPKLFSVRYRWPGGEGHSVASGPDRESALREFQASNRHVEVIE